MTAAAARFPCGAPVVGSTTRSTQGVDLAALTARLGPDEPQARRDEAGREALRVELSTRLLRDSYQLSPREIDICQRFVNQPTLAAIARQSGLTQESLRSVLKTIYEKTGRHSQAELMQLLKGLCVNFLHIP